MRVLIVSMRYLGDCVVAAALARSVKEKNAGCRSLDAYVQAKPFDS